MDSRTVIRYAFHCLSNAMYSIVRENIKSRIFSRVLQVVEIDVRAKFPQAKLWTVYYILDNCRLWSRISLERIKQTTSGKRRYQLRFFCTFSELWYAYEKWPLTYDLENAGSAGWNIAVVDVHVRTKFDKADRVHRFMNYRVHKIFSLSGNGEKSDNSVLWPWSLAYDLENQ